MREQLKGGGAHATPEDVLDQIPAAARGRKPPGFAHSAWELLEHLRIAQHDILEWSFDPEYVSPEWPRGFWPASVAPPDRAAWARSARQFLGDLRKAMRIAGDRRSQLLKPVPHSKNTLLVEQLLLLASHNSWHLGQMMALARALEERG